MSADCGKRWPGLNELALIGMWAVMLFGLVSAADYFRSSRAEWTT